MRQTIVRWAATTAIAAGIFWWFVVRELAPFGGYAAVATNHAGYFVGLAGWWSGLVRQAAAHEWIMGWPTCLGIAAAWLACDWTPGGPAVRGTDGRLAERADASGKNSVTRMASVVVVAIVLAFTAWLLTASGLLALAALSGFVGVWRRATIDRSGSQGAERAVGTQLAAWMLLAWFCGLLASVPLYYPYPRLSLPWVVVTWPLAGAALSLGWERVKRMSGGDAQQSASGAAHDSKSSPALVSLDSGSKSRMPRSARGLMTVLLLSVAVGTGWLLLDRVFGVRQSGQSSIRWRAAWQSRDQVRPWFEMVRSEIGPEAEARASAGRDVSAVVYVAGDPAAFFQLSAANRIPGVVFLPIADPAGLKATTGVPTYLLTHVPAGGTESSAANLNRTRAFYYRPSDLVMLDRRPASELRSQGAANDALRLHRIGAE
ncbi:MAG: hypothetical protein JNG89_14235 [Planctomycetaceae bacterium]|nr:hypothetical protein [Planctomycetaceae bacterium]